MSVAESRDAPSVSWKTIVHPSYRPVAAIIVSTPG
jgi:hypothetical protein